MRPDANESFESWINRCSLYEKNIALQKLKKDQDHFQIMEEFAERLLKKILHPALQDLKKDIDKSYNFEKDKENYKINYLDKIPPVADQVDDKLFDNFREK